MLSVERMGSGQDVVLIHGWGARSAIWREWAIASFADYRLTLIDLPGHGNSPVLSGDDAQLAHLWQDALLAVMPEKAIVIGWSLGGLLAQGIALSHPERVEALVLIASSPCFVQRVGWLPALDKSLFARYLTEVMTQTAGLLKSFIALQTLGSPQPRQLLKQLLSLVSDVSLQQVPALRQGLLLLETLDYRQQLTNLTMPTLWVLAAEDAIVPASLAPLLGSLQPQAEVVVLPAVGHLPFLSAPTQTAMQVNHFLQGVACD
jgi:pimeloyl-[acyl-carrier protein] methyl ester esterase